jgi:CheY-like chemotaxis protein
MAAQGSWSDDVRDREDAGHPQPLSQSGTHTVGPWSLLVSLEQVSADLMAEERFDPKAVSELRGKIDQAAQSLRARGDAQLADAIAHTHRTLDRIAAVSAVRRAELDELMRISRLLPSLLLGGTSRLPSAPGRAGPSLARTRFRSSTEGGPYAEEQPLSNRSIVVVNEDREVVASQNEALQGAGAQVRMAYDGKDALELCRKLTPDVIVADAFMSDLDGVAIARTLRRHALLRDVAVILVNGRRGLLDRLAKLGAPADGYLLDQADAASIRSCVVRALDARLRLEAELISLPEVRGDLEKIAPRTLVATTARLRPDAMVELSQGPDVFQITLRKGSLVDVGLARADGALLSQSRDVIRHCLGLRHGQFSVV